MQVRFLINWKKTLHPWINIIYFSPRFAAAAIAAFGAISLDHRVEKVPIDLKTKFNEVADEKALVLHDNLEVRDRLVVIVVVFLTMVLLLLLFILS